MEFCFINNNTLLDRRSQKIVRSHAMKGKNLGKSILARGHRGRECEDEFRSHRARTNPESTLERIANGRPLLPKSSQLDSRNAGESPVHFALPRNHLCGTELSYFTMSESFSASSRYLFHEFHYAFSQTLYPRLFCRQSKEAETSWFELMIAHPCVLHCGLAMTGAYLSRHPHQPAASLESTRHFIEAMRLLRHDLSTNLVPQDSSLGVIISLAIHANLMGTLSESRIHLFALKKIIELRPGGMATLCIGAPEVGNKVRRADLDLALMVGTTTLFGSQPSPLPKTLRVIHSQKSKVNLPYPLDQTSPALLPAIQDVIALCSFAGRARLGPFHYQDVIISILQRLVDYAPLSGPRPSNPLDDICQLGFLAFMSTVVHHNPDKRSQCSKLLSEALEARLCKFKNDAAASQRGNYSLFLWLNIVHAVSAPDYEQCCVASSPLAQRIHGLAGLLGLGTWKDVMAHLSEYPWITAFHDEFGKKCWESVTLG